MIADFMGAENREEIACLSTGLFLLINSPGSSPGPLPDFKPNSLCELEKSGAGMGIILSGLKSAARRWNRFSSNRSGNIAVYFALAALPLLAVVGVVVDYSMASDLRSRMQSALDAAVLAGVRQATEVEEVEYAKTFFQSQLPGNWGDAPVVSFSVDSTGKLTGVAQGTSKALFAGIFGLSALPIKASSAAIAPVPSAKVCILLVDPTQSQSLLVNSGAVLNAPECEIHVLSTANPAAIFNAGTTLQVKRICIKGKNIIKNGGANPPAETNCEAISDPFIKSMPSVSVGGCDFNNKVYDPGNVTLQPGVYCGWTNFNGSGKLTLKSGLYVIKGGGMTFNSGWSVTGSGVTFYLVDQNATLTFNGNVNATLSPPTSGTYANILIFEPPGLPNTNLPINGTSGSSIQGLLYLPSRDVTINSVSNVSADKVTMVFSSLIFNTLNWTFDPGNISMTASGGAASGTGAPRLTQ
jgi:hypothetical protein